MFSLPKLYNVRSKGKGMTKKAKVVSRTTRVTIRVIKRKDLPSLQEKTTTETTFSFRAAVKEHRFPSAEDARTAWNLLFKEEGDELQQTVPAS
jgi:hypothetical protein